MSLSQVVYKLECSCGGTADRGECNSELTGAPEGLVQETRSDRSQKFIRHTSASFLVS